MIFKPSRGIERAFHFDKLPPNLGGNFVFRAKILIFKLVLGIS